MPASGGEANEFDRLKTLLFSPEAERLSEAETHIHELEAWVGDAPRLETATAQILVEAFRRAEVARHRELAAAVAPVVVAAIRSEIHNSRDMMVEALYPITGRLVAAAVANAFSELLDAINQRIEALVSTNQWRLRFRSIVTGRSIAEIALSEAREATYARILLLERGSGRLLAHWRPGAVGQDNPDLISGMLAAISEFASTVLSEQHGELRTLDLGASQVYLRASSRVILAAEMVGSVSRRHRERLDAGFLDLVDRHDRGETVGEKDLADLAELTEEPVVKRRGWAPVIVLCALGALVLFWAWNGPIYRWLKGEEIARAFHQALADDLTARAYPLSVSEDWSGRVVTLRGLAGSTAQADRIVAAINPAASPLKVVREIDIVATASELEKARATGASQAEDLQKARALLDAQAARSEALSAKLAAESARTSAALAYAADLAKRLDAAQTANEANARDLRSGLEGALAATAALESAAKADRAANEETKARVAELSAEAATQRMALVATRRAIAEATRDNAVFFADRDGFSDPAAAAKVLDALAAAIKATGEGVRVVGYADESGNAVGNLDVSRLRAAAVAKLLTERGVPASALVVVGRGAIWPITDSASARARNRRVVFEPLFPGEIP